MLWKKNLDKDILLKNNIGSMIDGTGIRTPPSKIEWHLTNDPPSSSKSTDVQLHVPHSLTARRLENGWLEHETWKMKHVFGDGLFFLRAMSVSQGG